MAYESGTATSATDLLDKFRLFAISQGWTVNRWTSEESGQALCIQKNGNHFNFNATENQRVRINGSLPYCTGIRMNGSDGYDSGLPWDQQPGYPRRSTTSYDWHVVFLDLQLNPGPFPAYHFFSLGDGALHCSLEFNTGQFFHWGCGRLDMFNPSVVGGQFIYAPQSYPSTSWYTTGYDGDSGYSIEMVPGRAARAGISTSRIGSMLRVQEGSYDNWASSARESTDGYLPRAWQGGAVHDFPLLAYSPDPMNNVGILLPMIASYNEDDQYLLPMGSFPGLRNMNMSGYLPGDEFTLGADTWKVFPWFQKGSIKSEQYAIAVLKGTT